MKNNKLILAFSFLGGLVLLFIIAPLLGMLFSTSGKEITETIKDSEVTDSIWLTIWISMLGTIIFAIGCIPLAYVLSRKEFYFKKIIIGIINLPIVIPHSAAGIALLSVLSRNTLMGKIAESMGFGFVSSTAGIMLAMAFVSIPYLLTSAIDGFNTVPVKLEKAAMNLGASPLRSFFTITLPLAWRPVLSGLIMMWARGMSEFGAVIIIAYHPMTTPVMIFERFNSFGLQYARPIAVLFIIICLILFVALRLFSRNKINDRN
ncbi:MAG TPA: ABC transporter permease [Bacteroidales bacterium]|nr:ABC transporter permease [Bacteroidales bacterium]HPS17481.1 ABC transporter permease [Bacteroidales bacterium]